MSITVRKHKGRSGQSVYEWRVYRETLRPVAGMIRTQLAKYRTQEEAERAAVHYRKNDERVAAVRAAFDERIAASRASRVS